MEKMQPLSYKEKPVFKQQNDFETVFTLQGLERGMANTIGVALRRVLLSRITSLAPFCVRIEGIEHEFGTIKDVVEDVPKLIMNLRQVKFTYNSNLVADDEIVKVTLHSNEENIITAGKLEISNPSVKVVDTSVHIAEVSNPNALKLEMFLRVGRGFMSFEENKIYISNPQVKSQLESNIKKGEFIAVDSEFSPINKVFYNVRELNSSSPKIEEELEFTVITPGTVSAKEAIKNASEILIGHFGVIGDVDKMENVSIFEEPKVEKEEKPEDDLDVVNLGLSVRSLNALRKASIKKVSQLTSMRKEDLENIKNLGKKSVDEIIKKIEEFGYKLKEGEE
ncbi:DNA-directed RNA polymerase subunit alpha [Mycoplasmopsis felis]|uniref:DNA-directed RNA polymerase subunit alpha n=1 Tax=Mycoplasmopsis felis TaxID=33923 RepID=A0A809SI26_9BACT|nr:DNA-directed RNA polymerase subunit alpha [Mycoplasmopsis felis]BBU47343.1 DNA-directed RNA polymerase subunit alpha [Mycoplasmopsis felis]